MGACRGALRRKGRVGDNCLSYQTERLGKCTGKTGVAVREDACREGSRKKWIRICKKRGDQGDDVRERSDHDIEG